MKFRPQSSAIMTAIIENGGSMSYRKLKKTLSGHEKIGRQLHTITARAEVQKIHKSVLEVTKRLEKRGAIYLEHGRGRGPRQRKFPNTKLIKNLYISIPGYEEAFNIPELEDHEALALCKVYNEQLQYTTDEDWRNAGY